MKFRLGQFVKYELKNGYKLEGIVIAIDTHYGYGYLIDPLKMNNMNHWTNRTVDIPDNQPMLMEYFHERSTWGSTRRTKARCVPVGLRSKNLTSGEVQYDPNQMVDEEDDL